MEAMAGGRVSVGRVGEAAYVRLRCSADGLVESSTGVGSRTVAMGCEVERSKSGWDGGQLYWSAWSDSRAINGWGAESRSSTVA